jgi:hypothetical protein
MSTELVLRTFLSRVQVLLQDLCYSTHHSICMVKLVHTTVITLSTLLVLLLVVASLAVTVLVAEGQLRYIPLQLFTVTSTCIYAYMQACPGVYATEVHIYCMQCVILVYNRLDNHLCIYTCSETPNHLNMRTATCYIVMFTLVMVMCVCTRYTTFQLHISVAHSSRLLTYW